MNPSTALAEVVVDELVRNGVAEAVLSPGSRNAPLSFALHAADGEGRLRLHVRIDERTTAFLALGLAKASGRPVPVVTTSGTAAANLHPAVMEASHAGVPLIALTADRPPELRGVGANQTIDQVRLFGEAVRMYAEIPTPERPAGQNPGWRSLVCRAVAAARGALTGDPGPVHLNVPLREPLVPGGAAVEVPEALAGRPDGGPWVWVPLRSAGAEDSGGRPEGRTLVVAGDAPAGFAVGARRAAESAGWPLLAEPSSGVRAGPNALRCYPLLLADPAFLAAHRPDRVLVAGRPTLSRPVQALLADPSTHVEVITGSPRWADPGLQARSVRRVDVGKPAPAPPSGEPEHGGWLAAWRQADAATSTAVDRMLAGVSALPGLGVARIVLDALPAGSLLIAGSSSAIRDLDLAPPRSGVTVLANRGVAGIDGTVSTAVGAALAWDVPAYALLGDLTFLHDATALILGPAEPRPDLTLVVVNDDGGGLFHRLEQGAPEHAASFDRLFGTPTDVNLADWCAATGVPHSRAGTEEELRQALTGRGGLRVVEVPVDRYAVRELHERIAHAVRDTLRDAGF